MPTAGAALTDLAEVSSDDRPPTSRRTGHSGHEARDRPGRRGRRTRGVLSAPARDRLCRRSSSRGARSSSGSREPGLRGRPFTIVKFRTMRPRAPRRDDVSKRTRSASRASDGFLRATSLDELPELWNVLAGEMSLVGPRPLLMEYLDRYTPEEARRHDVRPGMTGWAAVNGRHATPVRGTTPAGRVVRRPLEPLAGPADHRRPRSCRSSHGMG